MFRRRPKRFEFATDEDDLDLWAKQIAVASQQTDLNLRRVFAYGVLVLVLIQIAIADRAFWIYAEERDWDVPPEVMIGFMSACVVQVIGIVVVIVQGLFNPRA